MDVPRYTVPRARVIARVALSFFDISDVMEPHYSEQAFPHFRLLTGI